MPRFHIHIDASWLTQEFEQYVTNHLGFYRTDFVGPDGGRAEPLNHLTLKLDQASSYRLAFTRVVEAAATGITGYIEGEYLPHDFQITPQPFDPEVSVPFTVTMQPLPPDTFRQSEFHIAMCAERSDPRLLLKLQQMGLLTIYVPKPWGISIIFTAQGNRKEIAQMVSSLHAFVGRSGGAVECSIKEERIVNWWISPGHVSIPPVIHKISWHTDIDWHAAPCVPAMGDQSTPKAV